MSRRKIDASAWATKPMTRGQVKEARLARAQADHLRDLAVWAAEMGDEPGQGG